MGNVWRSILVFFIIFAVTFVLGVIFFPGH